MKQLSPVAPKIPWKSTIFVLKYVEHAFGDMFIEFVEMIWAVSVSYSHSGCLMGIPILQDWILMIPDTPLGSTRLPGTTPITLVRQLTPGHPACSSSAALLRFTSEPNRMELKMIIPATNNPKARLFNLDPGSPAKLGQPQMESQVWYFHLP